ncbi:hypothetical protein PILCRDRAFT_82182, partial [Piloderma croceum F 1598]
VAVLGDGGVYVTAINVSIWLICYLIYAQTYDPTIKDAYRKQLVMDNKLCLIEVTDTAEEYATLRNQWVREGQGFILVYSIMSWCKHAKTVHHKCSYTKRQNNQQQKPIFMLVGNKCDKTHKREVLKDEGVALARSYGCGFVETSARTAHNVEFLFTNLILSL